MRICCLMLSCRTRIQMNALLFAVCLLALANGAELKEKKEDAQKELTKLDGKTGVSDVPRDKRNPYAYAYPGAYPGEQPGPTATYASNEESQAAYGTAPGQYLVRAG